MLERVAQEVAAGAMVEHLGTGGFASTFKVSGDWGTYALKVVDADRSDEARVQRELDALRRVSHPNVVAYRDSGTVEFEGTEYRWLSMDFVQGRPLTAVLAEGESFSPLAAVELLLQAVRGAAALWDAGTAHRDLSPNNLLITSANDVVVVDLGLARHLDDETITNLPTPGTPGWMSPEQVGPTPTHGDWRSDQFVLGLIAYRLLTGTSPFTGSVVARWQGPATQTLRSPRDVAPTIPAIVADIVVKMTAKAPHRRYLRSGTLLADLERAQAALAAVESPGPDDRPPLFIVAIGDLKTYATLPGFMDELAPDAVIVDARARSRTREMLDLTPPGALRLIDPFTYLSRSPQPYRPAYYRGLAYGDGPALQVFPTADARRDYVRQVTLEQVQYEATAVLAPYFYASLGELDWVKQSLECAVVTREVLAELAPERAGEVEPVWTTVAVTASWLSDERHRDNLLGLITGHDIETLHLLVSTTQPSFAPLRDAATLEGLGDVLAVMREAQVPVVLGRRGPEGLLGVALGAAGWTVGVRATQQNMSPHPDADNNGGRGYDRVYVPQLLNTLSAPTYQTFSESVDGIKLDTEPGRALQEANPTMEQLTSEQGDWLRHHNLLAMRAQATELARQPSANRRQLLLSWVSSARRLYSLAPPPGMEGESGTFLDAWRAVL
ncbi:serine/threonine protein kinase [Pedococcus sp. P5_B7]